METYDSSLIPPHCSANSSHFLGNISPIIIFYFCHKQNGLSSLFKTAPCWFACDVSVGRSWFGPASAICHIHSAKITQCRNSGHCSTSSSFRVHSSEFPFFVRLDIFHVAISVLWIQPVTEGGQQSHQGQGGGRCPLPSAAPFLKGLKTHLQLPTNYPHLLLLQERQILLLICGQKSLYFYERS